MELSARSVEFYGRSPLLLPVMNSRVSGSGKIMYLSLFVYRCQKKLKSYWEFSASKLTKTNSDCVILSDEIRLLFV